MHYADFIPKTLNSKRTPICYLRFKNTFENNLQMLDNHETINLPELTRPLISANPVYYRDPSIDASTTSKTPTRV